MHATSSSVMSILHGISLLAIGLARLEKLEEAQQATVETSLQNMRVLLKSPNFSKSQIIDSLLTLKLISKERNHAKAGFCGSVFQAMSQKAAILDVDFKQYLEVLLGNKDDEKDMELMSKAEKVMRNSRLNRSVMAVVAMAISKQPVHLGGVTSGAPLLVAQILPSEGELVVVRLAGVCPRPK